MDSSIWIGYLFYGQFIEEIESEEPLFISSLSLFETKLKLLKKKIGQSEIKEKLEFIKNKSHIITPDEKICELASEISHEKNIPAIDSLIYASAKENKLTLITIDNDFRGLDNTIVLS